MASRAIKGFDGIRGLAALSIVVRHAGFLDGLQQPTGFGLLLPLFVTGVPWFYVLSGFLITSLLIEELRETGTVSFRQFYIRRVLRLYPVLLTCLILVALFSAVGIRQVSFASWSAAAFYLYNYIPRDLYDPWLGSFHTLATEEHFYLVFPPLFMLLRRRPGVLMALLLAYAVVAEPAAIWVYNTQGWTANFFVGRWSVFAGEYIAAGCLAALAFARWPGAFAPYRIAFLVCGVMLYLAQMFEPASWVTNGAITSLIVAVVLSQQSIGVRILELAPLRYLGRVSYGLYVWQSFFVTTGPAKVGSWPLDYPYNLVLVAITVPLSWHFIEKPFLRLKERFRPAATRAPVAPAALAPGSGLSA